MIKLLILCSVLALVYSTDTNPHDYFVKKNICEVISQSKLDKFNHAMKIKCDWSKFRDENNKLVASKQSYRDSKFIYEIIFTPSAVPSDIEKYKIINEGLFSNFRLRSLSFQNLGIVKVEPGAFDSFCCKSSLATLDLSKNHLIRLDASALSSLRRLVRLNLASNRLSLSENNFESLKNLRYLDLSDNNIQYLPSNLLAGVTELELVNLDNNNLRKVDACIFDLIQKSELSRKLFPAKIELTQNPMDCDCALFYLARHRGYRVEANCVNPSFYIDKPFSTLKLEDPSKRCDYSAMEDKCELPTNTESLIASVIVLSVLLGLFFICCILCCCKYMSANDRAERVERDLRMLRSPAYEKSFSNGDKAKLLA